MDLPRWIRTPEELAALAAALEGAATVAIDTEADSLHHYPGKLCLVQVASDRGQAHLIDPLALPSLLALGPLCADPATVKVLHAAENDLAYLKRLYGFSFVSLFDTALAARLLGVAALSLDGLLAQFLELDPGQVAAEGRLVAPAAHRRAGGLRPERRAAPGRPARAAHR